MSRFSKSEAEGLGWRFVHEQDETIDNLGDGVYRVKPGSHRAEKQLPTGLLNEEAETTGLLLERIFAYEQHIAGLPAVQSEPPFEGDPNPGAPVEVDEDEDPEDIEHDSEPGGSVEA